MEKNVEATKQYRTNLISLFAIVLCIGLSVPSEATIIREGTDEEQIELQKIIDEYRNGSAQAQAIITALESEETGTVTVRFGNTIDIATADTVNKVITIDKAAVAAMKQIDKPGGGGKALEQVSMPYVFGHEALHILNPGHTEDQIVGKNNEVRIEKGSSKRTKYGVDQEGGLIVLPFDDGSKVDLTDALKVNAGNAGLPGMAIFQEANSLNLAASQQESGAIELTLDSSAGDQYMTLYMPDELGGGGISVKLMELSAMLTWSIMSGLFLGYHKFSHEI